MVKWRQAFQHFLGLLYPDLCVACQQNHPSDKQIVCVSCLYELLPTQQHLQKDNAFTQRFWGRFPLENGAALFHFIKGGRVQNMIHSLKYQNRPDIGVRLGTWMGNLLKQSPFYQDIHLIIPVPLHPHRQHQRGYNQSDAFARGLSESMDIPWNPNILKRIQYEQSQTQLSRTERLTNVANAFTMQQTYKVQQKHILLVDDVLTTGATLEACAMQLLQNTRTKISIVTIALAQT